MMPENEDGFLSVLSEKNLESLLTPEEALAIRGKLWEMLAGRAESYTMGGSSSVRIETAQELLRSAGFVLRHGLDAALSGGEPPEALRAHLLNDDFDALFRTGLREIEARVEAGRGLLESVVKTATATENAAYRDTLRELGVFFGRYHYHHFAHQIPCMIDYPLAHPVDEALLGIDYINEYLRRLLLENDFVGRYDPETVTALLRGVSPVYRDDLLNIYEAVSANALALTLLGGDIRALDVTEADRRNLSALLGAWTDGLSAVKLRAASSGLMTVLGIDGGPALEYLVQTASALYVRVRPMLPLGRLEHVFPPLYREKQEKRQSSAYVDNPPMDDERLRALIDALTSCRHVADKLALVRRYVFSLRDLAEILGVCFWDSELQELFGALSTEELLQLRRFAERRRQLFPEWRSETGWEMRLMEYGKSNGPT